MCVILPNTGSPSETQWPVTELYPCVLGSRKARSTSRLSRRDKVFTNSPRRRRRRHRVILGQTNPTIEAPSPDLFWDYDFVCFAVSRSIR